MMASEDVFYNLILREEWDEATERMGTEGGRADLRRCCCLIIGQGQYPLHLACRYGAPIRLVEAMLGECPELAKVADHGGCLPLHHACRRGDVPLVRLLLDAHPEGARVTDHRVIDHRSHLPLHDAAWVMAPSGVLRMLIDVHPDGAATPTNHGLLPIHLLAIKASPKNEEHVESVKALLQPILNNEEMLLLRYRETPLDIAERFDALSVRTCVKAERCPAEVIMMAARRHPEHLCAGDEDGNYPLHFAASNPNLNGVWVLSKAPVGEESRDNGGDEGVEAGDGSVVGNGGNVELSVANVSGSVKSKDGAEVQKDLIGELVKLYPGAAAARNVDGRFPLSLAIGSGKQWHEGVEAIADAAKQVVVVRDGTTNLYPFMLAATGDNPCLTTIYSLLRRCPEIKRYRDDTS